MTFLSRPVHAGLVAVLAVAIVACGNDDANDGRIGGELLLVTTTSTQESGLLDELEPIFEARTGIDLRVIAVGTGAALRMAANGEADAVLAHAYEAEQEFVDRGDIVNGHLLMYNDFVLVGPSGDPAKVAGAGSITDAMRLIARDSVFVSRGDESGTHARELALWEAAGLAPGSVDRVETGQGMAATLNIADQRRAYTLTDRATFLALRDTLELEIVFEGDARLLNIYHVYQVNPGAHPGVREAEASAFVSFMVSDEAVAIIRAFGVDRYGEPLFTPAVGMRVEDLAATPGRQ